MANEIKCKYCFNCVARDRAGQLEHKIERLERYMEHYIGLANVVTGFVALCPEHELYESVYQDVVGYLAKINGKTEFDLPVGPCEWEWSDGEEDAGFYTSCNKFFSGDIAPEYCPSCQGQVFTVGDEEDE